MTRRLKKEALNKPLRFGGTIGHQFCIDGYYVDEVLDQIPAGINIQQCEIEIGTNFGARGVPVPNRLKKLGVRKINQSLPNQRIFATYDMITKPQLRKCVAGIAKDRQLDHKSAKFVYIVLQNTAGVGRFVRTRKEFRPHSEDLRKKWTVMGLVTGQGKVMELVSAINAKKVHCEFKEEIVRVAICQPD